ncbi:bifunctional ADP-dependent NAD(P)H-hydrate dehydratase/NAD(P)H-hydrate epimerase [Amorphus coralli]|uniref:bifunctional ADP-dependent NAD(P)H-hydrate dehydratase/NAD(P)H-hydrate epimerase n=1 Tax=Amorphus coralli TaxID=340680 RepID=UPI00036D2D61
MIELLTPDEMGRADAATIASGTPGFVLMDRAGRAVADAVMARHKRGADVLVIAGPGNNGGDGFVAASVLARAGYRVRVMLLGEADRLTGDAATAAASWGGRIEPADPFIVAGDVIVDALFGAGLARAIEGRAAELVEAITDSGADVIAVDLPSGVSGRTGQVLGTAVEADATVTFFRLKPGHLLLPGRLHCGAVGVADIGIPADTLRGIAPAAFRNAPALWTDHWRAPAVEDHKYARGHAIVVSGPMAQTGAARLAAGAALRAGAGLVTVASPGNALAVNAAHLTAVMVRKVDGADGLSDFLADARLNAVLIGPGAGVGAETARSVEAILDGERAAVLDADALTSFEGEADALFRVIRARPNRPVVLTPHEGEFARLFSDLAVDAADASPDTASKVDRARQAAQRSGAVVLLKGPDTVVAAPDGRAAISDNAPAWLATAGSGDVLAGIVTALLAQRIPPFEAAAMADWMHGEAGTAAGPGLISEDLAPALKAVIARLVEAVS